MKSQSQHIVIYKDSDDAKNLYYGPFVSQTMALEFMEILPEPLKGGAKTYKFIMPYQHDEADLARLSILGSRVRDHPINQALRLSS